MSERRVLIGAADGPIVVPMPARAAAAPLSVSLSTSAAVVARWEFDPRGAPRPGDHLLLSPAYLDQGFVLMQAEGAPPVADRFEVGPLPSLSGELALEVRSGAAPPERLRLIWPDAAQRQRQVRAWERQQVPPVEWFYVELTTCCNLRCSFCPSEALSRGRGHMSVETARRVLGEIGRYVARRDLTRGYGSAVPFVFLHAMGEPLLHPRFVEVGRIAIESGLRTALFTNATLLDEDAIRRVLDAGVAHVTFSLNSVADGAGRPTVREQERRVEAFLRARAARETASPHVDIQYLYRADPAVPAEGVIEEPRQLWNVLQRWLRLLRRGGGVDGVDLRPRVDPERLLRPAAALGEDPSTRFPLAAGVDLVVKTACTFGNAMLAPGYQVLPTEHGSCPFQAPLRQLVVFTDGSTSFCSLDSAASGALGSLLDRSVEEIWTGDRLQQIRRDMLRGVLAEPLCQRCLGTVLPPGVPAGGGPLRS